MQYVQDNRIRYKDVEWCQGEPLGRDLKGLTEFAAKLHTLDVRSTAYTKVKLAGKNILCYVYRYASPQAAEVAIAAHNLSLKEVTENGE